MLDTEFLQKEDLGIPKGQGQFNQMQRPELQPLLHCLISVTDMEGGKPKIKLNHKL